MSNITTSDWRFAYARGAASVLRGRLVARVEELLEAHALVALLLEIAPLPLAQLLHVGLTTHAVAAPTDCITRACYFSE